MANLCAAFWNVQNLFEPGVVDRGPGTEAELAAKLGRLAQVITGWNGGAGPDLLGLAEVGTERIFHLLAERLEGEYLPIWEPPGRPTETGLGLLARSPLFSQIELAAVQRPTLFARPRCLLVRCQLHGIPEPVLVGINHWKSRLQQGGMADPELDRLETARWLGDLLAAADRDSCVVLLGDFNAEPFERPFSEVALRSVRFFSTALWTGATPAYVYNAAWRMLAEPDLWEDLQAADGHVSRPRTSHDSSPAVILDHLLVSGRALRGGPIQLIEASVELHADEVTGLRRQSGNLVPARWQFVSPAEFSGASDHFPLVARFRLE